jgi:hypothetical protein
MLPSKVLAFLIACAIIFQTYPNTTQAPLQENNTLIVYGSSTIASNYSPVTPNFSVYGILYHEADPNYLYNLISQYSWDIDTAYKIMVCESRGKSSAYNSEWHYGCRGSYGLFQVACVHSKYVDSLWDLYDPEENVRVAYEIWKKQGWWAWKNCYRSL